ncbi:MAG: methyltransferase domain-containing protein [Chloroflexi bacterium]|nr:methyltransferase domain-containing protein [Chloroflexota bacterium]
MKWLPGVALSIMGLFVVLQAVARIWSRLSPRPCPGEISFILENPLRRRVLSAAETLKRVGLKEGMTALELGPGPGFLTVDAARMVGDLGRLVCLDIQPRMLAQLKKKVGDQSVRNADLVLGSANALPLADDSLDLAFLVCVLGEVPRNDEALRELRRALRRGGILSITELIVDPDYSTRKSVVAKGEKGGFSHVETLGNFFYYTINFRKD